MKCPTGSGLIMLSLLATPVLAANKCVDPSGRISYQADPCPASSRGGDMSLNINRPFTGQAGIPAANPHIVTMGQEISPPADEQNQEVQPPDTER